MDNELMHSINKSKNMRTILDENDENSYIRKTLKSKY